MGPQTLIIGNKNYSSWSMRAWMLLSWLGLPFEEEIVSLYRQGSHETLRRHSPSAKVPVLKDGNLTIWDTQAIIDHLAESRPDIWPADRAKRAWARSICGEMHSGFAALRAAMPYNSRGRGRRVPISAAVDADIKRIREIWSEGRRLHGAGGPYLLGEFGIADIMFAPVATRFRTYGIDVGPGARAYWETLLRHPLCEAWFAAGEAEAEIIPVCETGID